MIRLPPAATTWARERQESRQRYCRRGVPARLPATPRRAAVRHKSLAAAAAARVGWLRAERSARRQSARLSCVRVGWCAYTSIRICFGLVRGCYAYIYTHIYVAYTRVRIYAYIYTYINTHIYVACIACGMWVLAWCGHIPVCFSTSAALPELIMPIGMNFLRNAQTHTRCSEVKYGILPRIHILGKTKRQLSGSQNRIRTGSNSPVRVCGSEFGGPSRWGERRCRSVPRWCTRRLVVTPEDSSESLRHPLCF